MAFLAVPENIALSIKPFSALLVQTNPNVQEPYRLIPSSAS